VFERTVRDYLDLVDRELPGFVRRLYVVGALEPSEETADAGSVAWLVLGPARLHYTLAHGDIIAKTAVGGYLAEIFPPYGELAGRAVRWRAGSAEEFTMADLLAAAESVDAVAEDARRRFG
jgi:hypothetical protein